MFKIKKSLIVENNKYKKLLLEEKEKTKLLQQKFDILCKEKNFDNRRFINKLNKIHDTRPKSLYSNSIKTAKIIFNRSQVIEKIDNNDWREDHLERWGIRLFYLQTSITSILMPYIVKVENIFKNTILDGTTIQKTITNALAKINKNWDESKILSEFSKANTISAKKKKEVFLSLLTAFRTSRNIVMHGNTNFLGSYFSPNENFKNVLEPKIFIDSFDLLLKKSAFYYSDEGYPTNLSIILLTLTLFNDKKISRLIFSKIDYEIFLYSMNTDPSCLDTIQKVLGLKTTWIKKLV